MKMKFIMGLLLKVNHSLPENCLLDCKQIGFELDNDNSGM